MFQINEILEIIPDAETDPAKGVDDNVFVLSVRGYVGDIGEQEEDFTYVIRPEVIGPNSIHAREKLQEWLDDGNEIPAFSLNPTNWDINEERDRRVKLGCVIDGVYLRGDVKDRENLSNLSQISQLRLSQGDTTTITRYKDGNNVVHELTPVEVVNLWVGGISYIDGVYQASWAIKDADRSGVDHTDDSLWPGNGLES